MADNKYNSRRADPTSVAEYEKFSIEDRNLIESFEVNSAFDSQKHVSELHIYTLGNTLLRSISNYTNYSIGLGSGGSEEGSNTIYIDPEKDATSYGYRSGGIKLLYIFFDNLFSESKLGPKLYIKEISNDRTELKLSSTGILNEDLKRLALSVKDRINDTSFFSEFRLNLGNNELFIGINIDYSDEEEVVTVKLYEPLPIAVNVKTTLDICEFISDPIAYEIEAEFTPETPAVPRLREANFNIDIEENTSTPSQYFNFDELFSYSVENSNYQVYSLFNEKGAELSIDHSNYEDFIHFSSAEERLINFKYKLDLLNNYSSSIDNINSDLGNSGITSDKNHYENLIEGIVNNFDHYERFLYFESGSYSWPKSNTKKPYVNQESSTSEAITWFADQRTAANNYDVSNFNALTNTIPTFIREDDNNAQYTLFVQMIAQHFDNLWIYSKAVSDKYNADNRLNVGVSRDLVEEAIKSLGVKLYNSSNSLEDLFKYFVGEFTQDTGEGINENVQAGTQVGGVTTITEGAQTGLRVEFPSDTNYIAYYRPANASNDFLGIYTETDARSNDAIIDNPGNVSKYEINKPYFVTITASDGSTTGKVKYILKDPSLGGLVEPGEIRPDSLSIEDGFVFHISRTDADGNDHNDIFKKIVPSGFAAYPIASIIIEDERTVTSSNLVVKTFDPLSKDLYQKNIYKRIYHNLPFLLKTKGTQRGLRALINCFGIPSNILKIKTKGGRPTTETPFLGTELQSSTDNSNIRVNDNGTIISGSVLSQFTSMVKPEENYNQDLHNLEVGFSPSDNINNLIVKTLGRTFNVDDYIGDPRDLTADSYNGLLAQVKTALADITEKYDVKDFVRLIKFFDNVVFKMIKDFVPARSTVDTGVIIKPHILDKSKAKSVAVSVTQPEYSGSISVGDYSGSNAGIYESSISGSNTITGAFVPYKISNEYDTGYSTAIVTPEGFRPKLFDGLLSDNNSEQPKYTGELKNSQIVVSDGELNRDNTLKSIDYPTIKYTVRFLESPPVTICFITDKDDFIWKISNDVFNAQLQNGSELDIIPLFGEDAGIQEIRFSDDGILAPALKNAQGKTTQILNTKLHFSDRGEDIEQYGEYKIEARNGIGVESGSDTDDDTLCNGRVNVRFVKCAIKSVQENETDDLVGEIPRIDPSSTSFNLLNLFEGLDINTKYQISTPTIGNIESPETFNFSNKGFNEGDLITFTCTDEIDTNCSATSKISFTTCDLVPRAGVGEKTYSPTGNYIDATTLFDRNQNDEGVDNVDYYVLLRYKSSEKVVSDGTVQSTVGTIEPFNFTSELSYKPEFEEANILDVPEGNNELHPGKYIKINRQASYEQFPNTALAVKELIFDTVPQDLLLEDNSDEPLKAVVFRAVRKDNPNCAKSYGIAISLEASSPVGGAFTPPALTLSVVKTFGPNNVHTFDLTRICDGTGNKENYNSYTVYYDSFDENNVGRPLPLKVIKDRGLRLYTGYNKTSVGNTFSVEFTGEAYDTHDYGYGFFSNAQNQSREVGDMAIDPNTDKSYTRDIGVTRIKYKRGLGITAIDCNCGSSNADNICLETT